MGGTDARRPPLVFLHEGLGSLGLARLARPARRALGCRALATRAGYGRSPSRRTRTVLHAREAQGVLPALLDALRSTAPILLGHSDGASIALSTPPSPTHARAR